MRGVVGKEGETGRREERQGEGKRDGEKAARSYPAAMSGFARTSMING